MPDKPTNPEPLQTEASSDRTYIAHHRTTDGATQPLADHLRVVAARARDLAARIGLGTQGELIGLVHDLGKYSDEFQAYLKSAAGLLNQDEDEEYVDAKGLRGKIDHSTAGAQHIWNQLSQQGRIGPIAAQMLAICVASHHSGLIDCLTSDTRSVGEDVFGKRMAKAGERTHLDEALARADERVLSRVREVLSSSDITTAIQRALSSIVAVAPNADDRSVVAQFQFGLLVRFLFSCLIDADRIDSADFERPGRSRMRSTSRFDAWDVLVERLEWHLQSIDPRLPIDRHRREISRHCRDAAARPKGVFSLTVPTGGGKTLASLRFALHHAKTHGMERVCYFVPFTTIIDQNAGDVRGILEPEGTEPGSVVLEHHSNLTQEQQSWRAKILAKEWDAPVVFATNVQFLDALFGMGTRGARRMHRLANAVLIFDEIQTLPVNCVHLFNNVINFLVEQCGSTVVLCTATQPLLDQVDPTKGAISLTHHSELVPDVRRWFQNLKRVDVISRRKAGGWTNEEIASLALEETSLAGSCLVVVNTKEAARTLYGLCKGKGSAPVYHLSTNLCPAHRKVVLNQIKAHLDPQRPSPTLCVSTQLIEAGVNLDFGSVIRFAAGLDSVAQAAGRCNRHGRRAMGRVHVINARDEHLDRLRDIRDGRDVTERVLDDFDQDPRRFDNDRIGPAALQWYYQNYFFARAEDMDYPVSAASLGHDDTLLNLLSCNTVAVAEHARIHGRAPAFYFRQSFMAASRAFRAIDAPTVGLIVPYSGIDGTDTRARRVIADLAGARDLAAAFPLLHRAQQFSVNVFPHVLQRLMALGAIHEILPDTGILVLDERHYSKEFGVSEEAVEGMEALNA